MNMALFPRPGDLELSMKHLVRLLDNNSVGGGLNEFQCSDCADVQIRIDTNDDPDIDEWGFWDKLAPFQSVYDKKGMAWSAFNTYYCLFTPTDAGTGPPNPRGFTETLCFPLGLWATCGSTVATTSAGTGDCGGTGIVEPDGKGVFMETKFNLAGFLGQRIEIRWIMESWVFDGVSSSYFELGTGWDTALGDDGWWLDDITVVGTVEQQVTPQADTRDTEDGVCLDGLLAAMPASGCDNGVDDGGTIVSLKVQDLNGNILDGVNNVPVNGQSIRVSAIDSQITGGCANGIAEFQFFKHGALVQDWGPKTFYLDAPENAILAEGNGDGAYQVKVRCSTDFSCTSIVGGQIQVPVYAGHGGDTFFGRLSSPLDPSVGVLHDGLAGPNGETTLNWWSPVETSDLYRGTIDGSGQGSPLVVEGKPLRWLLDTTSVSAGCYLDDDVLPACVAASIGWNCTTDPIPDLVDDDPPLGQAYYYLVAPDQPGGDSAEGVACANPLSTNDASDYGPFTACPSTCGEDGDKCVIRVVDGPLCPR
jgi:hypothetical protein